MPREIRRGVRDRFRKVAEPLAADAQQRFLTEIGPDERGRVHSRYGVSVRRTGTVTVEQRAKSRFAKSNPALRRPKFTAKQHQEVLGPAVTHASLDIDRHMNDLMDDLERNWAIG